MGHRRRHAAQHVISYAHDELDDLRRRADLDDPGNDDRVKAWEWFIAEFDEDDIYAELLDARISNEEDAVDWAERIIEQQCGVDVRYYTLDEIREIWPEAIPVEASALEGHPLPPDEDESETRTVMGCTCQAADFLDTGPCPHCRAIIEEG